MNSQGNVKKIPLTSGTAWGSELRTLISQAEANGRTSQQQFKLYFVKIHKIVWDSVLRQVTNFGVNPCPERTCNTCKMT